MGKMATICTLAIALIATTTVVGQSPMPMDPGPVYEYGGPPNSGNYFVFYPRQPRYYGSIDGGVLGLSVPAFNFFQLMDDNQNFLDFLETDDGQSPTGMIGGTIGVVSSDRYSFEARGFYSRTDSSDSSTFNDNPGTSVGWADIAGGSFAFTTGNGVSLATDTHREVEFANFDLVAKYAVWAGDVLVISPYAGLSMFQLNQIIDATGSAFVGGAATGDGVVLHEDWEGSYLGVVFGCESHRNFGMFTVTVDGSLGFYQLDAERNARESVFGPGLNDNIFTVSEGKNRGAISARLRVELIRHFGWCDLSLFGGLNFLSAVPTVAYSPVSGAIPPSEFTTDAAGWYTAGLRLIVPY